MKRQLFLVAILCLVTGCGAVPLYRVGVNSISADTTIAQKDYIILPAMEGVTKDDLQFREYASYIQRALEEKGFQQASDETANLVVFVVYGIGEPSTRNYSYSLPIYGQTGGGMSYFNANISGSGGYSTASGSIYSPPQYGVVGSQSYSGSYVTYSRYLILDAYDAERLRKSEGKDVVQMWKTIIKSTGTSGDLRRVLPVMVAAAKKHISTDTKKEIRIELKEKDQRVQFIKGVVESTKTKK